MSSGVLSRRSLLMGAGATALTACSPSRTSGTSADPPVPRPTSSSTLPVPPLPGATPGPVVIGELVSERLLGERTRWALTRPPGVEGPLPLVVALHGHGGSAAQLFGSEVGLPRYVAAAVADGVRPFALVAVSGGNGFWHEQPSGEDAGAMVVDELLPLLARRTDLAVGTERVGLLGWSMGGYGALHLAPVLGPERVAAVCASSPGLFDGLEGAMSDAFADEAAYEEFSVMDRQADLDRIPLRISCGTEDRFYPATRTYVDGFPDGADLTVDFAPGGHDLGFTRRSMPDDLAFVASRL